MGHEPAVQPRAVGGGEINVFEREPGVARRRLDRRGRKEDEFLFHKATPAEHSAGAEQQEAAHSPKTPAHYSPGRPGVETAGKFDRDFSSIPFMVRSFDGAYPERLEGLRPRPWRTGLFSPADKILPKDRSICY